jgi:hypothetical protein
MELEFPQLPYFDDKLDNAFHKALCHELKLWDLAVCRFPHERFHSVDKNVKKTKKKLIN